jgi:hypothetical protein
MTLRRGRTSQYFLYFTFPSFHSRLPLTFVHHCALACLSSAFRSLALSLFALTSFRFPFRPLHSLLPRTVNMRFTQFTGAALLASASIATSIKFDPESEDSIRAATKQYAAGLMKLYQGGAPGTAQQDIGIWPAPHYWWEGGAAWGGE